MVFYTSRHQRYGFRRHSQDLHKILRKGLEKAENDKLAKLLTAKGSSKLQISHRRAKWMKAMVDTLTKIEHDRLQDIEQFHIPKKETSFTKKFSEFVLSMPVGLGVVTGLAAFGLVLTAATIIPAVIVGGAFILGGILAKAILNRRKAEVPQKIEYAREVLTDTRKKYGLAPLTGESQENTDSSTAPSSAETVNGWRLETSGVS